MAYNVTLIITKIIQTQVIREKSDIQVYKQLIVFILASFKMNLKNEYYERFLLLKLIKIDEILQIIRLFLFIII